MELDEPAAAAELVKKSKKEAADNWGVSRWGS